jgi:hypothetical protein
MGEQMSAHISACADCAAALDALSFEGEIYARYERGLEPTPALWARVSAEIARAPQPETPAKRRPFLSRARESFIGALGALALRPALASSLALLLVGVTAGSLWLARRSPSTNQVLVAETTGPANGSDVTPTPEGPPPPPAIASSEPIKGEPDGGSSEIAGVASVAAPNAPRRSNAPAKEPGLTDADIKTLLGDGQQAVAPNVAPVAPNAGGHDGLDEIASLMNAPKADAEIINANAQLPDADEKDMARHVEQTQMLLRSIKNARASDDGATVNVAYEKNLSRQLLADNATLKLEAEVKGDKDTKQVLDTIEPFLLDIANMREQASREEVRSLRERVKKTEIIASLQVY